MRRFVTILIYALWGLIVVSVLLSLFSDPAPKAPQPVDIRAIESGEFSQADAWLEVTGVHFDFLNPQRIQDRLTKQGSSAEGLNLMWYFAAGSSVYVASSEPRLIIRARGDELDALISANGVIRGTTYLSGSGALLADYVTDRYPETASDTLILTFGEKPTGVIGTLFLLVFTSALFFGITRFTRPRKASDQEFHDWPFEVAYLDMDENARGNFLKERSDEYLIMIARDLDYLKEPCSVLDAELERRQIDWRSDERYRVAEEFLGCNRWERRLPNSAELTWRTAQFLGVRYGFIALFFSIPITQIIGLEDSVVVKILFIPSLVVWIPILTGWYTPFFNPPRYALVRPFNDLEFSKALKGFIRRNIGLQCMGFTLSDRNYRPNHALATLHILRWPLAFFSVLMGYAMGTFAMIGYILSPWLRQSIRLLTVSVPTGGIDCLQMLNQKHRLAGRHLLCGGQCFNVRTIDEAWKYSIQTLFHASDFVLVDLSMVREGSEWEISQLIDGQRTSRCIAVCQEGFTDALDRHAHLFPEVVIYDRKGRIIEDHGLSMRERIERLSDVRP